MKKSQKQLLSVLFHGAVLTTMVLAYDAGILIAEKAGLIEGKGENLIQSTEIDLMAQEAELGKEIDPALEEMVSRDGDAYLFRRDMPFPPHLKVISTNVTKFNKVRMAGKSRYGQGSMELSLRNDEVMEYEMAGRAVRFTMRENSSERIPTRAERLARLREIEEAVKKGEKPPEARDRIVDELVGKAVQFNHDGTAWKAIPSKEFKTMAWGRELENEVAAKLVENGLRPRPRWFGTGPMKTGDVTKLSAESLNLVFDGITAGSVQMTLGGMEGVHGHPCAVFEVTGNFILAETEDAEGLKTTGEATIDKGRIWCSLLYPVVLRGDLDLIVSMQTKDGAKTVNQIQGAMNESFHRDWKAVTAQPKEQAPEE